MSPDWLEVVTLSVPLIVEPAVEVNLPCVAVKIAVLPVTFATLRSPVLAVTVAKPFSASILPLIVPPFWVITVTALSVDVILDSATVVKVPFSAFTVTLFLAVTLDTVRLLSFAVILTEFFFASTAPFKSPSFTEILTALSVALIIDPSVVVNLLLSAVIVTVLPEILLTLSVSPLAVIFTLPEADLTSPLILPVLAVISTLPAIALMVVPALVSIPPSAAEIFTVL
ncbi:hypothetical protein BVZ61_00318 [Haemophilus influenzae]|nr:hypothetical protein BVZ61_00318 [Haemophilus influenzae]PRM52025.1 hypothetical protein BVZ60_00804 [Haemophilus influenzae]